MTELDQLRDELAAHRRELDRQRQEALLAREVVRQTERALAEFKRTEGSQRQGERARLAEALKAARARAERSGARLTELLASEGETRAASASNSPS